MAELIYQNLKLRANIAVLRLIAHHIQCLNLFDTMMMMMMMMMMVRLNQL